MRVMARTVAPGHLPLKAPGDRSAPDGDNRINSCPFRCDRWDACQVDPVDRTIVMALQADARISFRDLAALANLSPNATAERLHRLERDAILRGYTAILDESAAGR